MRSPVRQRGDELPLLHTGPASVDFGAGAIRSGETKQGASVVVSVFNVMKDSFSVSSLALPFAMVHAGPGLCLVLIVVLGLMCLHTARLLGMATVVATKTQQLKASMLGMRSRSGRSVSTYAELGKLAMGATGEWFVHTVMFLTCIGACAGWFVAIGSALHEVIPSIDYVLWVIIVACFTLPLNWLRDVSQIGYASGVSAVAFTGLIALIVWVGAADVFTGSSPTATGDSNAGSLFDTFIHWQPSAMLAYGIVKFCYAGHEVFLSILQSLTPTPLSRASTLHETCRRVGLKQYMRTMTLSFLLMMLVNAVMASSGYLAFGAFSQSNILVNLSALRGRYPALPSVAQVIMSTTLTFTVPIVLFAAFEQVEEVLSARFAVGRRRWHWATNYNMPPTQASLAARTADEAWLHSHSSGGFSRERSVVVRRPSMSEISIAGSEAASINSPTHSRRILESRHIDDDPIEIRKHLRGIKQAGYSFLGRVVVRTPIVAIAAALAAAVPNLGRVVSLVGAVGDSCLGLIMPTVFYILLVRKHTATADKARLQAMTSFARSPESALLGDIAGGQEAAAERERKDSVLSYDRPATGSPSSASRFEPWWQRVVNVFICLVGVAGLVVGVVAVATSAVQA